MAVKHHRTGSPGSPFNPELKENIAQVKRKGVQRGDPGADPEKDLQEFIDSNTEKKPIQGIYKEMN